MSQNTNIIGRNVSRERYQRGWTQGELATKMQLFGCYMTRDIIASIEIRRCIVTDKQIEFFAAVFRIPIQQLFPSTPHFVGLVPEFHEVKRRRKPKKKHRARRRKK